MTQPRPLLKKEHCDLYQQPRTTNYWWYIRADSSLSCVRQVSGYRMVIWYTRAEEARFYWKLYVAIVCQDAWMFSLYLLWWAGWNNDIL